MSHATAELGVVGVVVKVVVGVVVEVVSNYPLPCLVVSNPSHVTQQTQEVGLDRQGM